MPVNKRSLRHHLLRFILGPPSIIALLLSPIKPDPNLLMTEVYDAERPVNEIETLQNLNHINPYQINDYIAEWGEYGDLPHRYTRFAEPTPAYFLSEGTRQGEKATVVNVYLDTNLMKGEHKEDTDYIEIARTVAATGGEVSAIFGLVDAYIDLRQAREYRRFPDWRTLPVVGWAAYLHQTYYLIEITSLEELKALGDDLFVLIDSHGKIFGLVSWLL